MSICQWTLSSQPVEDLGLESCSTSLCLPDVGQVRELPLARLALAFSLGSTGGAFAVTAAFCFLWDI